MTEDSRLLWKQALLLPDPQSGWRLADRRILGIPALVRLLLVLKRCGVEEVILPADALDALHLCIEPYEQRGSLPNLTWLEFGRQPALAEAVPALAIGWGNLPSVDTLHWFGAQCSEVSSCGVCLGLRSSRAVLASFFPEDDPVLSFVRDSFQGAEETKKEGRAAVGNGCTIVVPDRLFLAEVGRLTEAEGDRELLRTVGKPTDRWHVVWIRNRTFPVLKSLAELGATPNQISVAGFLVAVFACLVIASGGYYNGIAGAAMLYASWVLDCMDGTLARLTFSESAFGKKLDTLLGHFSNLMTFGAIIWAAYGSHSPLKAILFGFVILGGILVAHRVSRKEQRGRPAAAARGGIAPKLSAFLDKINHRDYAVIVLALALADGFRVFVWLSAVGVQVFWLAELWLIRARTGAASPGSGSNTSR